MLKYKFVQARHYYKGRIKPVQLIVIHSMEAKESTSTAENVANYFATTDVKASAHFCIDNDSVVQCVATEDTAWHCKNANANGIGIEHAGYAKQTRDEWLDPFGKAMFERSAQLCADLARDFNIPVALAAFKGKGDSTVVTGGFCGHADVPNHGSHWDPGKGFPWDYFLDRVEFYQNKVITWKVPTREELNLDDTFTPMETALILGALELKPMLNAEREITQYVAGRYLAGLPLQVLLHALAEKESTYRPKVIGTEKDGTKAYGLYQFHQTTAEPVLKKIGKTWDEFLNSVPVQTEAVIRLIEDDYIRMGTVKGAFRQFGKNTQRVLGPIIDYLEAQERSKE